MNNNEKLLSFLLSFVLFGIGIGIAFTKSIPQGHYAKSLYIGNYAYIISLIFISYASYIVYKSFDDKK